MNRTPISLLEELRLPNAKHAWDRFILLYTPLLYIWAERLRVRGADAEDLIQDVFATLIQKLPEFQYDRSQRFRGWLWTVTLNKARERFRRSDKEHVSLEVDPVQDDATTVVEEREYREYLTRQAMALIQADFEPVTWRSFWETVAEGRPVVQVAEELGITPNAIYLAKARVLSRLRTELAGLLD